MARWDYQLHGGVYRDVPNEGIERLIMRRDLKAGDMIAYTGTEQWTPIGSVPAFADVLARIGSAPSRDPTIALPEVGNRSGAGVYLLWFVITGATTAAVWHAADGYNPEGNGMYNLVEASLLNHGWLQVLAALLSAIFSAVFFAGMLIASRIRTLALINRAGHLAIIEELRRTR